MAYILAVLTVFAAMAGATVNQTDDRQLQTGSYFCWKSTHTRGVGGVPLTCPAGEERLGLLCYNKCPVGTTRVGLDCHSICPAGFADQGLFCRYSEYGRGVGYPWKFGDWLDNSGMTSAKTGGGLCTPSVIPGYTSFGCCLCRPDIPDCEALGLGGRVDLSCAKKITIGTPKLPTCAANEEYDAGLCYPKCKPNYTGVGPVCWGRPPPSWVQCGMGAAKTSVHCGIVIKDQLVSVGILAFNIVTGFAGSAVKGAADASRVAQLSKAWLNAISSRPWLKKALDLYAKTNGFSVGTLTIYHSQDANFTTEDYVRTAAVIVSLFEPTGVASVAAAYTYPTCDKVAAFIPANNEQ
ncbi:hypothetical protein H257_19126 [Aphanomyces astaci]|uniref:Uncharacterized protein n=1 Tax=Aphanomyces astaci TaxID=112090 RepID=W4F8Y0_APHAT|nr:hypothetical protein H257_19126 [Aphanomyces astaci]ETV63940.1 hypothetical protein H257_19126 [Aphanomyces astaci]|eukprot:XP_009846576.1 hypothetical protein H257_19126 [Aphanomyces astaci]